MRLYPQQKHREIWRICRKYRRKKKNRNRRRKSPVKRKRKKMGNLTRKSFKEKSSSRVKWQKKISKEMTPKIIKVQMTMVLTMIPSKMSKTMMDHRNLMKIRMLKLSTRWILSPTVNTVSVKGRGSRSPRTRERRVNMWTYDNQRKRSRSGQMHQPMWCPTQAVQIMKAN